MSSWATRPLSQEQLAYAAIDAVVLPVLVDRMRTDGTQSALPSSGGTPLTLFSSWRFTTVENPEVAARLKAKQVAGVSQGVRESQGG